MLIFYLGSFLILIGHYFDKNVRIMVLSNKKVATNVTTFCDSPYGIRTRVTAVKRRCLNPLTNGPFLQRILLYQFIFICQYFFEKKEPKISAPLNINKLLFYIKKQDAFQKITFIFSHLGKLETFPP